MDNILFINSQQPNCGVYQFGKRVYNIIRKSTKYGFPYLEGLQDYENTCKVYQPKAIIINYHPSTMPYITHGFLNNLKIPKLAIYHEVPITGFDYYINPDPTYFEHDNIFVTGRPLFEYNKTFTLPDFPIVGSFGFGFDNKRFDKIVDLVNSEFDDALIRLHIPYAYFGDVGGDNAKRIAEYCKTKSRKPTIRVEVTHHFLNNDQLLDFLAQNTINVFMFDNMYGRGISSSTDYALSVRRPLAITNNWMHRHIRNANPTITLDNAPLKWIIEKGDTLEKYRQLWSDENLIRDYERILNNVI